VQIDYFTTIAQIINFLILIYLLRRFMYKPIIKLMDEREQKIISQFKEAEQKKKDAEKEAESHLKLMQELSEKRMVMNAKAAEEAQILQNDLMEKVRNNVETSRINWNKAFLRQKESLLADLSRHAGYEIYAIVRRTLQDLADEDLENQIINTFIKRLRDMDAFEKEKFSEFYKTSIQQITVRSTFEIPEVIRRKIREIVDDQIGVGVKMQYEIAPELICGVEMIAHDMRIAWSIASFLNTLETDVVENGNG
jgi:F-type H+-transporting ATPase subunit b